MESVGSLIIALFLMLLGGMMVLAVEKVFVPTPTPVVVVVTSTPAEKTTPYVWEWAGATLYIPDGYTVTLTDYNGSDIDGKPDPNRPCQNLVIVENNSQSQLEFLPVCRFFESFPGTCPSDTYLVTPYGGSLDGIVRYYSADFPGWWYTSLSKPWIESMQGSRTETACFTPPVIHVGEHSHQIRAYFLGDPSQRDQTIALFDQIIRSFQSLP